MSAPVVRRDVYHYDPTTRQAEIVRGLREDVARRLIEHEVAAGRVAYYTEPDQRRRTYR